MNSESRKQFGRFDSVDSSTSSGSVSTISLREKSKKIWRPSSLINLASPRKNNRLLQSSKSTDKLYELSGMREVLMHVDDESKNNDVTSKKQCEKSWNSWDTVVNIILVEAKNLPAALDDDLSYSLYCTLRLGPETYESKSVSRTRQPQWMEEIKLHLRRDHNLTVTLWNKGTQTDVVGSCMIDLSKFGNNRTYDIWEGLGYGFGTIHLSVSLCSVRNNHETFFKFGIIKEKFPLFNTEWDEVGKLKVKVLSAKGLSGKPNAYCTLKIDNEELKTHSVRGTSEPVWDMEFEFKINDITSTIDVAVYDSSLIKALRDECIGQIIIPLLRLRNGELRWYALKRRSNRDIISGNFPRLLLEFKLVWNPLKASLILFQPKEEKKSKGLSKFNPDDIYHNVVALGTILYKFTFLNEYIIQFLEWENRELCTVVLLGWTVFWYNFEWWMLPLILLLPFIYYWIPYYLDSQNRTKNSAKIDDDPSFLEFMTGKNNNLADKLQRGPETALNIKKSVDFIIISAEKVHNLLRFKVPFLSYFVMFSLVILSFAIRFIAFKYFMMSLGVFKYTRKYLHPDREHSNELINFLCRIPDNKTVKDWKEFECSEETSQRPLKNSQEI